MTAARPAGNPWLLAARPRTLGAAVVPVAVGSALAVEASAWHPAISILAMLVAVLIQIATNYFNDALDHRRGADTAERTGPLRVTSAGLLPASRVMAGGAVCLAFAALLALPLAWRGGWPIVALGLVCLACAYAYTGGPFPLAYLGLGEVFVIAFFGVVAVAGTFYLNTLNLTAGAVLAGLQIGLHASVLLAVNNLRDLPGDRAAGKRTLAARFGLRFARIECAALVLAPFVLGLGWLAAGLFWAFVLPLVALPLAWWLAKSCLQAEPSAAAIPLLAQAATLHALFGIALACGLVLP